MNAYALSWYSWTDLLTNDTPIDVVQAISGSLGMDLLPVRDSSVSDDIYMNAIESINDYYYNPLYVSVETISHGFEMARFLFKDKSATLREIEDAISFVFDRDSMIKFDPSLPVVRSPINSYTKFYLAPMVFHFFKKLGRPYNRQTSLDTMLNALNSKVETRVSSPPRKTVKLPAGEILIYNGRQYVVYPGDDLVKFISKQNELLNPILFKTGQIVYLEDPEIRSIWVYADENDDEALKVALRTILSRRVKAAKRSFHYMQPGESLQSYQNRRAILTSLANAPQLSQEERVILAKNNEQLLKMMPAIDPQSQMRDVSVYSLLINYNAKNAVLLASSAEYYARIPSKQIPQMG